MSEIDEYRERVLSAAWEASENYATDWGGRPPSWSELSASSLYTTFREDIISIVDAVLHAVRKPPVEVMEVADQAICDMQDRTDANCQMGMSGMVVDTVIDLLLVKS